MNEQEVLSLYEEINPDILDYMSSGLEFCLLNQLKEKLKISDTQYSRIIDYTLDVFNFHKQYDSPDEAKFMSLQDGIVEMYECFYRSLKFRKGYV